MTAVRPDLDPRRGGTAEDRLAPAALDQHADLEAVLDRAEQLAHEDPRLAEELATRCRGEADERRDLGSRARSDYLRARLAADRGELERALELIDDARGAWLDGGDPLSALRTDLGRMHILDDLGRHGQAVAVGEALVATLESSPATVDPDEAELRTWLHAAASENLGVASAFAGDHGRALDCYSSAESAYLTLGETHDTTRARANRAIEMLELGEASAALELLQTAAAEFEAAGDRLWWAKCQGHVAQVLRQLGNLVGSLRILEPARITLDELGAQPEAARLQLAIADLYLDLGLAAEARTEARSAVLRFEALGMAHDTARAQLLVALAHLAEHASPDARAELDSAVELLDQVGDRQYRARARLVEADLAEATGRHDDAVSALDRAVVELRSGGWTAPLAEALLRLAEAVASDEVVAAGHRQEAGELIDRAHLPVLGFQRDLAVARVLRRDADVEGAEAVLRRAVTDVDLVSDSLPSSALRTAFRADRLGVHDELVDLLATRGRPADLAEACRLSDQAKSQVLADLVSGTFGGARASGAPDETQARLRRRLADLGATYLALQEAEQPTHLAALRARAADLESQVSALRIRVSSRDPVPGAGAAVTTGLAQRTPAVSYHVAGADVLAFVLDGDDVQVRRLPGARGEVAARVAELDAQWSRFDLGASFVRRHHARLAQTAQILLRTLHETLLEPVLDALGGVPDELTVVPHGLLAGVPFHALLDGNRPLVERCAVTVSPALGLPNPTPTASALSELLVLAVPDARAPEVETEARAIARLVPEHRLAMGSEASVALLRSSTPGPDAIHLACHGVFRPGNPLFSRIRLGDRWLTCAEVLDLDLSGALVTLSACESGRQSQSAEPVGLAWAFLAAGASGVVVSRWAAHDVATTMLMTELYRHLADGSTPAVALRLAQLRTAAEFAHPYYWAAFSYVRAAAGSVVATKHRNPQPSREASS